MKLAAGRPVDRRERLVEQEHRGLARERPRHGDALLLAARQRCGPAPLEAREMNQREQLARPLAPSCGGRCPSAATTLPSAVMCGNSA